MVIEIPAVLGIDAGGTSSTVGVLTAAGEVATVVRGPGANLRSSPGALPTLLGGVVRAAVDRARERCTGELEVVSCVAGVSGAGPAGRQRVVPMVQAAMTAAGLRPDVVEVVTDPVVAFAAGSPQPDGALLLSGTGAVACRFEDFAEVARCDGLGWLLGDTGSGVWLGLEGLRAAAADLDGRGPATALTPAARELAATAGPGTGDPRQDLVRLLDARSPAQIGDFAPVVTRCAAAGDEVAATIVDRAVSALLRTLSIVDDGGPAVVLAGSVLTTEGPVRAGVLRSLGPRARDAASPVVGALRLAAERVGWPVPTPATAAAGVVAAVETDAAGAVPGGAAFTVDGYRPDDLDTLYDICLRTGDSGGDATAKYRDGALLGHVFLGPYVTSEPELARVLRRPDGTPVGYCVATSDTVAFEQRCERSWWPPLRERYPLPAEDDSSDDARLIRHIHRPPRTTQPWLEEYPAHLHIDIVPEGQGGGNGRRLIESVLDAVAETGAPGIHLGVSGLNVRAVGFYEHIGLRMLEHTPWGLIMGMRLARS